MLLAFRQRFITDAASKSANVAALWNRKQRPDESAEDFISATRRLATRIPIDDEALVCHAAIRGLRDDIKRFVMLRGAETLDQVMAAARLAEATSAQTPTSGDKVLRELDDIKRLFGRLIATSSSTKPAVDVSSMTAPSATAEVRPSTATTAAATPAFTVQYVVPAAHQSQVRTMRGGGRGRGGGVRRREWGPRWVTSGGPSTMTSPYGYAQTAPPQPMMPAPTRQPAHFSATAQPFQPSAITGPPQMNGTGAANGLVCANCGLFHEYNVCRASAASCFRCGFVGHFARCCHANPSPSQ